jgi:FtsH-binding integral membrane protein
MEGIYSGTGIQQARGGTLVGRVMGLLAFSLLFTAGGALLGRQLGPGAILISIAGSLGALIALYLTKSKPGLNLGLFYAFSVFEGMALGLIVESYLERGLGAVVVSAAVTTGGLVMLLGVYAWTTRRDLSGLSGYLMAGLLAVVVASLVGIFLQAPLFRLILSAATALGLQRLRALRHPTPAQRRRQPARRRAAGRQHLPRHLQPVPSNPSPVRHPQELG